MINNFTPANNFLSFCHQGFAGLNMFHKLVILKERFLSSLSYSIIVLISFAHTAHADQVKRDFLESTSNSAHFFLGGLWFIVRPSYGSFISLGLSMS